MPYEKKWWKEAVVYQIYPRSFNDSNNDGVGDIAGITEKLDYIKSLGVDVIWLCPIYRSPNDDNGYDISDYYDILPEFGTMKDFDLLLNTAHQKNLKIVMDLVVNHTSDENALFVESRSSKDNDKRDFYIWRKGKGANEPNNWQSFFTPSAWEFDETTNEYFLHLFSKKQPDFNWENEKVRETVYNIMRFWLDKGIDGFRMDVINCIAKAEGLPDVTPALKKYEWAGKYFMNLPKAHTYLREMNEKVLSKYDNLMTVGETPAATPSDALLFAGNNSKELNMIFQSELMDVDAGKSGKWEIIKPKLTDFKKVITKWQTELHGKAWNSIFLGNHDQPRCVSRFGNDKDFYIDSAKLLATLLLTLEGTPYIFQGDEIGMTNIPFNSIDDCRDIESINFYKEELAKGCCNDDIIKKIRIKSRDNARTPMQWNTTKNAGFSEHNPWIDVNPNFKTINAKLQENDSDSILSFYKRMIKLRKENPLLIYGEYVPIDEQNEKVMAYYRVLDGEKMLVILNFSESNTVFELKDGSSTEKQQFIFGNQKKSFVVKDNKISLNPYESMIFKITK